MKDKKKIYRLQPIPSYDVEAVQAWLQDMAKQGWHLEKDGFLLGIVSFEKGESKKVRYRLEASLKSTSMWADNNGEPEEEAMELNQQYGWEYVSKCKDFYVYRCEDESCRELNTDPKVQELALKEVCKRQGSTLFSLFFWLILYPYVWFRSSFFLTMIQLGTGYFLLGEGLVFWIIFDSIREVIHLNRLRKKLQANQPLFSESKPIKKKFDSLKNFIQILLLAIWLFTCFTHGNDFFIHKKTSKISTEPAVPFATILDFVQDEKAVYQKTYQELNGMETWTDWLAPVNISWSEHATIHLSGNQTISGGYRLYYHETIHPYLAGQIAKEYVQLDKKQKGFEERDCPDLEVDYAYAYLNSLHFPTIVLQKGNKVIHAMFYQTSPFMQIEFEEWVQILAESLKTKEEKRIK